MSAAAIVVLAVLSIKRRTPAFAASGIGLAAYIIGGAAHQEWPDARWIVWTTAALVLVFLMIGMVYGFRSIRASKEFERFVNTEATSLAFFGVTLCAGAYGLLGGYLDLPRVSGTYVFLFAMLLWAALKYVVERRVS